MKIIKPSVEIIEQEPGLDGIYAQIERAGRSCYASSHQIKSGSAKPFVERLISSGHGAMLEHGAVYLQMPYNTVTFNQFDKNPYSKVSVIEECCSMFVSTNFRVIIENHCEELLKYLVEPGPMHERRITARFQCQIAISREFNRHRVDSIAEQSTRYCNYSADKFGNSISVNLPSWVNKSEIRIFPDDTESFQDKIQRMDWKNMNGWHDLDYWLFANQACEFAYLNLIRLGWKAQQARVILPLDTNTDLVHTAFLSDWKHFFELRCDKQHAHPDAYYLANELQNLFIKKGYVF